MKHWILWASVVVLSQSVARAESFKIDTENVQVSLGAGQHVCAAEGFKDIPVVRRGVNRKQAEVLALRACKEVQDGNVFSCDILSCEKDGGSKGDVNITVDISRDNDGVSLAVNNRTATHNCEAESTFRGSYVAEAPTLLEAQVLARRACIDNGNSGYLCDIDAEEDCFSNDAEVGGVVIEDGKISVDGVLEQLERLNKWKDRF